MSPLRRKQEQTSPLTESLNSSLWYLQATSDSSLFAGGASFNYITVEQSQPLLQDRSHQSSLGNCVGERRETVITTVTTDLYTGNGNRYLIM